MPESIHLALEAQYTARSGFFWLKVANSSFKRWQRKARSATWRNLVWDWESLGITSAARAAADRLGFVPSEVFAHPDVLAASPALKDYYRLLACLPNKGLAQIKSREQKGNLIGHCRLLNGILSSLLATAAKASHESLLNTVFAEAGTEWQGTWVKSIGSKAARTVEKILNRFAADKNLLDPEATAKLNKKGAGLVLLSGTILRFASEPDVECRSKDGKLICVIEIKGSTDKAGAQTRLGETKKSFTKAKLENPRCHTIFLPSIVTEAVRVQLKTEREIDQVFDLLEILSNEKARADFLEELFKFRLREKI
jgi:hypothetical protein